MKKILTYIIFLLIIIGFTYSNSSEMYESFKIQKKLEGGIGFIVMMFFFLSIYSLIRVIKWKLATKEPNEKKVKKFVNNIINSSNYSVIWGVIQIIGSLILINNWGLSNFIGILFLGLPLVYFGYHIKKKLNSYLPFMVINSILFIYIYVWTFFLLSYEDPAVFQLSFEDPALHQIFNIDGLGVYRVGPSIFTHFLSFITVSGWISYWILRKNKYDVSALINYMINKNNKKYEQKIEQLQKQKLEEYKNYMVKHQHKKSKKS